MTRVEPFIHVCERDAWSTYDIDWTKVGLLALWVFNGWAYFSIFSVLGTNLKILDLQTERINLQNKAIIELYERVDNLEHPPIEIELPDGYSGWKTS